MKTSLFGFVFIVCTAAWASPKTELMAHLSSIDTPVSLQQLKESVGPQLPEFLREIAIDPQRHPLQRQRAAAMLQGFPSQESKQALLKALEDDYGPVRKAAVLGLVRYLGEDRQVEAKLLQALDDDSVVVRKAAIHAVAQLPSARLELTRRKTVEKDAQILRLLNESVK